MKVTGESFPVAHINLGTIEAFKNEYSGIHSKQGININLRFIKTFLNWCERKSYIDKVPRFKPVKIPESPPAYINDDEFEKIIALDTLGSFYKQLFIFHRDTGLRLSEPYQGTLEGKWLIIQAQDTKQKREHEVELSDELIKIWELMMTRYHDWIKRGMKPGNFPLNISKTFHWACKEAKIENHKFHDLRHTFAVRMYLVTNDIYKVRELLGHNSVTTTEKYAKFNRRRLANDFPSLKQYIQESDQRIIMPKVSFSALIRDTN
jgi:integrase